MPSADDTSFADEVRLSFVASLYQQRGTLFAGMIAHVVTTMAVYLRIDDTFYLYAALALFVVWLVRNLDMMAFDRLPKANLKLADTLHWEKRYVTGSFITCSILATICGHALVVAQDPFAELVTVSVTLASMISVVGRNFGSRFNVDMIILAACLPMMTTSGTHMSGDHGALEVEHVYTCEKPGDITRIDFLMMGDYPDLHSIEAVFVSDTAQIAGELSQDNYTLEVN